MKKTFKYYENLAKEYYKLKYNLDEKWNNELAEAKKEWNKEAENNINNSKSLYHIFWRFISKSYYQRLIYIEQINLIEQRIKFFQLNFSKKYNNDFTRRDICKNILDEINYPLNGESLEANGMINFIKFMIKHSKELKA